MEILMVMLTTAKMMEETLQYNINKTEKDDKAK